MIAAVSAEEILVTAVLECRAACLHGALQHGSQLASEAPKLGGAYIAGTCERMHAGEEACLVRIDAAQSADGVLIEEGRLHGDCSLPEAHRQRFGIEVEIEGLRP